MAINANTKLQDIHRPVLKVLGWAEAAETRSTG